jgi:asparagine synthase (glutamine-hydrolysing)
MDLTRQGVSPALLCGMGDRLAHRGPDDEGYVLLGRGGDPLELTPSGPLRTAERPHGFPVGLANRRLAILDPTPAGRGPMSDETGAVWLTYNGEVYNFVELRKELRSMGHTFRTRTDTEVVLTAYLAWGLDCFSHLNGMWGLALWDGRTDRLVLSRDRLGIKPLYLSRTSEVVAFASEPKAFETLGLPQKIDWDVAFGYLDSGYSDWGTRTFLRNIDQVEPGTYRVLERDGSEQTHRYWSLDSRPPYERSRGDAVRDFRDLFLDSVRIQLRSDVAVGTCLSGGLDSSSIAGAIARERSPGTAQHAFSCVFPRTALDESVYIDAVARKTQLESHKVSPTGDEFVRDFDALLRAQDEPFPSSSSYAQWRVMKLASSVGLKVLLDGQGGDELLAGYSHFFAFLAAERLREGRPASAARELWQGRHLVPLHHSVPRALAAAAPERVHRLARRHARRRGGGFLDPELRAGSEPVIAELERTMGTLEGSLRRALLRTAIPVLLRSEDRSSMAHSVEARVPFLDHRLVELAASLPSELKLAKGTTKIILREAMADLLPQEVRARRDKIGFATPEASWLLGPGRGLIEEALDTARSGSPIQPREARKLVVRASQGDSSAVGQVWRIVCFERWRNMRGAA